MQALLDHISTLDRPTQATRLFHGRGGRFPGHEQWALDAFPPVLLLTSFAPVSDEQLQTLDAALHRRWAEIAPGEPLTWVFQQRDEFRVTNRLMAGKVPEPHEVDEDGTRFGVHLLHGQNHGFFLDMAQGRRWVRHWASSRPGGKVLNLFAYTCAFSVVALQAGAAEVVNVDMASGPLSIGRRNHQLNGVAQGAQFLAHDIFNSWAKIRRGGPYDLVIMDPPSFQKGSFVATKDYARLIRRLPELVAPDGHALVCLNTPKLDTQFLRDLIRTEAPDFDVVERLPNPAAFEDVDPERALKVLVVRPAAPRS